MREMRNCHKKLVKKTGTVQLFLGGGMKQRPNDIKMYDKYGVMWLKIRYGDGTWEHNNEPLKVP